MVCGAFSFYSIVNGFYDTVGDTDSDDIQRKMQASVEQYMTHVPDPFKWKRKHIFFLLKPVGLSGDRI